MDVFSIRTGCRTGGGSRSGLTACVLVALATAIHVEAAPDSPGAEAILKQLEIAPGLQVELFAADPLLYNPVAFSIDEKGRFFISETHRYKASIFDIWAADQRWKDADASFRTVEDRAEFLAREFASDLEMLTKDSEIIRLVEDRSGDGRADFTSVFADGFNETTSGTAAGVLAIDGEVWFTNIPDLWRFEMDEAGNATRRERLHTGYGVHIGVSGHDLHGLVMGPDGKLYFSVGDRGSRVTTREGKVLDNPDTGAVFRCDPDGGNLEVFAIGLRNPQELAFDRVGNLWAHDNDTAGKDQSRVIHVVEGADYGWRYSYQFMAGFGPWVQERVWAGEIDDVLPNAGHGAKGPAGLAYYPGVGLSDHFDHRFIACDFPQGVWSFTIEPKGASYEIAGREKFLWNAGPTDVAFGPDGDVYISDWGRSYQMPDAGRIYRVFDPEQAEDPLKAEVKKLLGEGMNERSLGELADHLGHADMRVRQAAQFQLIKRAAGSREAAREISGILQEISRRNEKPLARVHAIWALETLRPDDASETVAALLEDSDAEIRAQAAKWIGSTDWDAFAPALQSLLLDPTPRVRAFAASSLGKLARANAIPDPAAFSESLLQFIRDNDGVDAYLTHAGMMALLDAGDFELIQSGAADTSPAVRRAALLCMRRLASPDIVRFLVDPDPRLRYEAARAINDIPIDAAMPDLAALLAEEAPPRNMLSRAINANFRLGEKSGARRLARFAAQDNAPEEARADAIAALGDWANPAPRDRAVGLWRPLDPRNADPARRALAAVAEEILRIGPEAVQIAAVESAARLQAKELAEPLFNLLRDETTAVTLRRAIPPALVKLEFSRLSEMMALVLSDEDLEVRRSGIELLDQVEAPNTTGLLARLLATENDLRLSQSAVGVLGSLDEEEADWEIAALMDRLLAGELPSGLHLDVLEAAGRRSSRAVRDRLDAYAESFSGEDPLDAHRALLCGGDAGLGKKIFYERDEVGCLRCHAVNGQGGNVGPELAGIGGLRTRRYLLESILEPNRHFAPGHERIVLTLKNGKSIAGVVEEESADQITLSTPEVTIVQTGDVQTRHPAFSAMPAGLEKLLTERELRDLIEFLASLQ